MARKMIWLLLLCASTLAIAQKQTTQLPNWSIKTVPNALLSATPTALFGFEYRLQTERSINAELGYVFPSSFDQFQGYRFNLGYRFYEVPKHPDQVRGFVSLEHRLKQTFDSNRDWFLHNDRNYSRLIDYKVRNTTNVILLAFGQSLGRKTALGFEYSVGIGARRHSVQYSDFPEGFRTPRVNNFWIEDFGNSLQAGVRYSFAYHIDLRLCYHLFRE